jgi:thiol:disulfide interchange protein
MLLKSTVIVFLFLALLSCSGNVQQGTTDGQAMVTDSAAAPYYTNLVAAQEAAGDNQNILIDFYTDW